MAHCGHAIVERYVTARGRTATRVPAAGPELGTTEGQGATCALFGADWPR